MKGSRWAALGLLILCLAGALLFRGPRLQSAAGGRQGLILWVELDRKRLTVYENGEAVAVYPIAAGAFETPSPVGVFRITHRFSTQLSGFGTRFLGLNVPWGQYGIHGTNAPSSIGQNASHGCIRLRVKDAEALYRLAPVGARVVIEGGAYGALSFGMRALKEGDRGADVAFLQRRLIQRGFLSGGADGVFGASTRRAVIAANKALALPLSDQAGVALQKRLGMERFE